MAQGGPPLLTDDPGTPGPGRWEINVALTAVRQDSNWLLESPTVDWNYGVGERIQLNLETPWVVETASSTGRAHSAMGDTRIGVKWRFLGGATTFAVSTYPHLTVNSPGALLLPLEVAGRAGSLLLNGEIGVGLESGNSDEWLYGFAVERDFADLGLLAEIHGVSRMDRSDTELVWNVGARAPITGLLTLLVALGTSLPGATHGLPRFLGYVGGRLAFGRTRAQHSFTSCRTTSTSSGFEHT